MGLLDQCATAWDTHLANVRAGIPTDPITLRRAARYARHMNHPQPTIPNTDSTTD